MRGFDRPTETQAECENEVHGKLKAKNSRSDNSASNTITFDNDTMVEVLKHLNYCQLAKSSLVSKRYRGLIQKNRHKMALLSVCYIGMRIARYASGNICMFGKVLSSEDYNEWLIRNHYSKQLPLESQIKETQISVMQRKQFYQLLALANYKDPSNAGSAILFEASVNLNHENAPLFQHFVRLLTDPFIYIGHVELIPQVVSSLLTAPINPDHNRVKCNKLSLNHRDNTHEIIMWIKDNVLCNLFQIFVNNVSNYHEVLLDLFMTGANCTSEIRIGDLDLCDVVVGFVKKFMDLKSGDENQFVESIKGKVLNGNVEGMKRSIAEFVAKEEEGPRWNTRILEFVNNDIGKKLHLTTENVDILDDRISKVSITIDNM
ncbi:hypothetical protein DdX_13521 [Ditylenchus destructor]|uniref:F-box domain-containing protein n=1 Tax=Ditylenchus destructor TaxID=166010 RepID=A0AAD4MTR1_9BILA|nr:hypothetical protein DdX_13521 [Ditylenchus destructor]